MLCQRRATPSFLDDTVRAEAKVRGPVTLVSIGAINFVQSAVAYERDSRMMLRPNILKGDPGHRLSV
jgi:hypothetical protein